ncbi:hypothetical protein [uncultured Sneathiella sp.]|jgi:hypothetical protein|uniref:hypothetical protein n=1 Tax=uncultured Sneathiella sp. TaxID=879315 RepID=UPI0030DD5C70|tara:strand:+ start:19764 stop:20294 length:531 start_codon:yes stop_codon:yes gene_type:complete
MLGRTFAWLLAVSWPLLMITPAVSAEQDRYVGYYYPAPAKIEIYCARVSPLPDMDKRRRVGFVIGIKEGMANQPYESAYSVFVKGGESRKLIIVAKTDGHLKTIYRVRALLADLTNSARTTPIFEETGSPENLTFLDLITLLGFQNITLSDGDRFTHQIEMWSKDNKRCGNQPLTD